MKTLTLESLFKSKIANEEFDGAKAYFRKMSVRDSSDLQVLTKHTDQMVHIIASTLCDEKGDLLFDDETKQELFHHDMHTVSELSALAMKHSGLLSNEEDEIDAVKS